MGGFRDRLREGSVTGTGKFFNSGVLSDVGDVDLSGLSVKDVIKKLRLTEVVQIEPISTEILKARELPGSYFNNAGPRCYSSGRVVQVVSGKLRDVIIDSKGKRISIQEYGPGDIVIYQRWATAIPHLDDGSIFVPTNFGRLLAVNNGDMMDSSPGKHIEIMLETGAPEEAVNYAIDLLIIGDEEKKAMKRLINLFDI